jgi:pyrroloquinoline quinone biosynthesis protein D
VKRKQALHGRSSLARRRKLRLAPGCRLAGGPGGRGRILYCPSGAVQLNELAIEVLSLCDGRRTREQIVARLLAVSRRSLARNVRAFLVAARRNGWLVSRR